MNTVTIVGADPLTVTLQDVKPGRFFQFVEGFANNPSSTIYVAIWHDPHQHCYSFLALHDMADVWCGILNRVGQPISTAQNLLNKPVKVLPNGTKLSLCIKYEK